MGQRLIILLICCLLGLPTASSFSAEGPKGLWNAGEVATLNVVKDLGASRIGRDYIIDGVKGDDERGDGTEMSPWKTIARAFDYYAGRPAPGDAVRIKAGVYHERLWIRSVGTAENPILVGPYGNGEVIIDASLRVTDWKPFQGQVFVGSCAQPPTAVVLDEKPLFPERSVDAVGPNKWYYDVKDKLLYVYMPDSKGPEFHELGAVAADEGQDGIFLNIASHLTLYGLTLRYAGGHGISILGPGNKVMKCNLEFNGKGGVFIWSYGDTIGRDVVIAQNHIYHNMIKNWPRGRYKWGLWTAGAATQGPGTQFIGNVVHDNGGEGLLAHTNQPGVVFRDNVVYDNWSVNVYVDGRPDSVIENNLIYCHDPDPNDLTNNGDDKPGDGRNLRRLRAEGIMTADENSPATFGHARIINNQIIGCRRAITHYGRGQGSGWKDVQITGNTIVLPNSEGRGEEFIGINIPYNSGNNADSLVANNIIYSTHPKTTLLSVETPLNFAAPAVSGVSFKNNVWFHKTNSKPFRMGPRWLEVYRFDLAGWQAVCKDKCSGDVFKEPDLSALPDISKTGK